MIWTYHILIVDRSKNISFYNLIQNDNWYHLSGRFNVSKKLYLVVKLMHNKLSKWSHMWLKIYLFCVKVCRIESEWNNKKIVNKWKLSTWRLNLCTWKRFHYDIENLTFNFHFLFAYVKTFRFCLAFKTRPMTIKTISYSMIFLPS